MLISVIVPVYNTEPFLTECIESILNQTYRNIEVILVDDGSSDGSSQICDYYEKIDNRVRVFHKQNEGLVLARHDGALKAKGDYITFVDGDDFILPNRIQSFVNGIIESNYADIICGALSYYPNTEKKILNMVNYGVYTGEKKNNLLSIFLSQSPFYNFGISPNLVSKCVKRDFYCAYESIPSQITLGEDMAVTYKLVLNASSINIIGNDDYMYRYNEESITHKYDELLSERICILLEHLRKNSGISCKNIEKQITDYHCLLIKNVVLNDFQYYGAKYRIAKKKLCSDLELLDYKNIIDSTKFNSLKDKILYWLIRNDLFALLYFLVQRRR